MNFDQTEPQYILYSRGQLIESTDIDQETAIEKLASATRRTSDQVKKRLLNGKRKKLKSSSSLKKLILLQKKLTDCGLNAYIDLD